MDITIWKYHGDGELEGKRVRPPRNPPINVTVNPNEYQGDENCCENELNV